MGLLKNVAVFILFAVLSACSVNVKNAREARLMPEEVAQKVVAKYFGAAWARNPVGHTVGAAGCSGEYPMPFRSINHLGVSLDGNNITAMKYSLMAWPCGNSIIHQVRVGYRLSEADLDDLVDAFVSLGASIKEVERK